MSFNLASNKVSPTFNLLELLIHNVLLIVGGGLITGQENSTQAGSETSGISVFIVKYNYNPLEMSPNPNHDSELALVAGDYIYVFGEMDSDGFYRAQLMTGEEGLVPSNFVEKVDDDGGKDVTVVKGAVVYCVIIPLQMTIYLLRLLANQTVSGVSPNSRT